MSFSWPKYAHEPPSAAATAPSASPTTSSIKPPPLPPSALGMPPPSEGPTSPGGSYAVSTQGPASPSAMSASSEATGVDKSVPHKRQRARGPRDPIVFSQPKPGYVIHSPDGSAFTRSMIQYDTLNALFSDTLQAFTPPASLVDLAPERRGRLLTFRELYEESYLSSSKITRRVKESMRQSVTFAKDHLMVAFLVNVGKINTTAAFYPEMKTLIRHFHSIPVIQKTELSKALLQDSPRIKACLRAVEINTDGPIPPYTLEEVEQKTSQGCRPSTSIINLLFTFTGASAELGERHLPRGLDFFDLLMANDERHTIPSVLRAKAILWLLWRYHEGAHVTPNLHEDQFSAVNPGKATRLPDIGIRDLQAWQENIDSEEEVRWGRELEEKRKADVIVLKEMGGVGRGKKGEKRSAFWGAPKTKKSKGSEMDDIEAELDAISASGGPDNSSVQGGPDRHDFDDDDDDELEEEIDEPEDRSQAASSPLKREFPTLDVSYYVDPKPAGPPRDKRLLHLAYSQVQRTMDNPVYDSDSEEEPDDQALHDFHLKLNILRECQRLNGHSARPPSAHPASSAYPAEPSTPSDATPGVPTSGTIPKLKLTFGGGKKASLSALLN